MTTSKKAKEKHIDIDSITIKAGVGLRRPFFGNIEAAMFEKLYNKIMKTQHELFFDYHKEKGKFKADTHDCTGIHLIKLFRMIKEAKYLGSIYQEMYSEDPKYFHSFQFFKNEELEVWMKERLTNLNEINDFFHFDEVEGKIFIRLGMSYEKYSIGKSNIVFFNKKKEKNNEDEESSVIESTSTFSISEDLELTTLTNLERMVNTLYRTIYALNPHKLEMIDYTPIDHIKINIDFKNPTNNKVTVELED